MNMHDHRIPLSIPDIWEEDVEAVSNVLRSGRLSLGPKVPEFEEAFATFVQAREAVAVSSGTAALHVSLLASGIKPGDEVITTPFSFVASANSILYAGARPVFVDIDEQSLNLDPDGVESRIGPHTTAILPVHVFGRPCQMDSIMALAERHKLVVVEDACEALGSQFEGRSAGTFGRAGTFAFYPNKQMTTGEGGMIVSDDMEFATLCRSLRNQGRLIGSEWLEHVRLGYNFRMTEMQAALGSSQLRRVPEMMAKRTSVVAWYQKLLSDCDQIQLPVPAPLDVRLSWFVYVVRLENHFAEEDRNWVLRNLREQGVECSNYFPAIHLQPYLRERFGYRPGDFPVTESIASRTVALPFHSRLSWEDTTRVASALKSSLQLLTKTRRTRVFV